MLLKMPYSSSAKFYTLSCRSEDKGLSCAQLTLNNLKSFKLTPPPTMYSLFTHPSNDRPTSDIRFLYKIRSMKKAIESFTIDYCY